VGWVNHSHQFRRRGRTDVGRLVSSRNWRGSVNVKDSFASNFVYS
jgi:hypothetical protein